jgi:tricorn protease
VVYEQLGEIHLFDPATRESRRVAIDVADDRATLRPHLQDVSSEIQQMALSPSGLEVAFEAHGEILTAATGKSRVHDLTNTPGIAERSPAWSPDGRSIAYFSDEAGLYALHIASSTGGGPVRKFRLSPDPAYYYQPVWSPDARYITFYDNRLDRWVLDTITARLTRVDPRDAFGLHSSAAHEVAWSPDSKWLAYSLSIANHLHVLCLYSVCAWATASSRSTARA